MNLQDQISALEAGVGQLIQAVTAAHAAFSVLPLDTLASAPDASANVQEAAPASVQDVPANVQQEALSYAAHGSTEPAVTAGAPSQDALDSGVGLHAAPATNEYAQHMQDGAAAFDAPHASADADANAASQAGEANTAAQADHVAEAVDAGQAGAIAPDAGDAQPEQQAQPEGPLALVVTRPSQNEITMTINGNTVVLSPPEIGQLIEMMSNARASMLPEPPEAVGDGWNFVSTRNPAMIVQKQPDGERLLILRHTGHGWVPFTFSPENALEIYMLLTQH